MLFIGTVDISGFLGSLIVFPFFPQQVSARLDLSGGVQNRKLISVYMLKNPPAYRSQFHFRCHYCLGLMLKTEDETMGHSEGPTNQRPAGGG